jgi:hypothetical protein
MNQIVTWLTGFFWYTPLVACAFLITKRGEFSINPFRTLLAAIPLLSLVVIGITLGVRGRIMWVVSLLLIAGIFNRQKKIIAISLVMAILLLPIFAILGDRDTRGTMVSATSQAEIFRLVYEEGKKSIIDYKDLLKVFLDSFAWRAQGCTNSVILYRISIVAAGVQYLLRGIFAFVPRLLWPENQC